MCVRHLIVLCGLIAAAGCLDQFQGSINAEANRAPEILSAHTVMAPERVSGVIYTAAAHDPDGDAITYSIAGGADAERFRLAHDGGLSFRAAPDFEAPADANRDNVYEVMLRASDGRASADLAFTALITDIEDSFFVRRVATGLATPMFLTGFGRDTNLVLVALRDGRIVIVNPDTGGVAATPFLDVSADVRTDGEFGLLGMALAPDFESSGVFYIHMNNLAGDTEIRRYVRSSSNPNLADPASGEVIFNVAQPAGNHNGGWIGFGHDGYLYIAIGDGGGGGDPFENGQNLDTTLGAILRIDPSTDDFPGDEARNYGIPAGNPFPSGAAPEIWAWGLRNPFRASFDRDTGDLYIGDVGQNAVEEVDLIPPGVGGLNFGWNVREGTLNFTGPDSPDFTPPVLEYNHGDGERQGNSITGGVVYRGPASSLHGHYIFGDFISGNLWSVPVSSLSQGTTLPSGQFVLRNADFTPDAGAISLMTAFAEDSFGNVYILTIGGAIFRIEAELRQSVQVP